MIGRRILMAIGATLATACASTAPPPPASISYVAPPAALSGLDRIVGRDARNLVSLFGTADQDVWEASARKLQFGSAICILDAYLYPPSKGREPLVTYVDARQPDGRAIDKASCVAALTRRKEAR